MGMDRSLKWGYTEVLDGGTTDETSFDSLWAACHHWRHLCGLRVLLRNRHAMRLTLAVLALAASYGSALAQQQPYAGMESRAIKTLSDQQIADLKEGNGMGLALAGELNGYPGPRHAIDLAEQLRLSPDQVAKLNEFYAAMKSETMPMGATLIA